jgi:hypothetical protein
MRVPAPLNNNNSNFEFRTMLYQRQLSLDKMFVVLGISARQIEMALLTWGEVSTLLRTHFPRLDALARGVRVSRRSWARGLTIEGQV